MLRCARTGSGAAKAPLILRHMRADGTKRRERRGAARRDRDTRYYDELQAVPPTDRGWGWKEYQLSPPAVGRGDMCRRHAR